MVKNDPTPSFTPRPAGERRDRALRLRKRLVVGATSGALMAVAGLGVLAEHTDAGRTQTSAVTTASASSASTTASTSASSTSGTTSASPSTAAPVASSGTTVIVSGGS